VRALAKCLGDFILSLSFTFRLAGWIGLAAIVVLSLMPGLERPRHALGLAGHHEHLLAYILTAGAFGLGYLKTTTRCALFAMLVFCAALLETLQLWVPGRTAKLIHFGASSMGAGFGLMAAALVHHLIFSNPRWRTD
jgi:VanZ family protein